MFKRRVRFTISHLMLWTFGCAVGIAIYRTVPARRDAELRAFAGIHGLLMGTAFGTTLAGYVLLQYRRLRSSDLPLLPGHLLVKLGLLVGVHQAMLIVGADAWDLTWEAFRASTLTRQLSLAATVAAQFVVSAAMALATVPAMCVMRRFPKHWQAAVLVVFFAGAALALCHLWFIAPFAYSSLVTQQPVSSSLFVINEWSRKSVHVHAAFVGFCAVVLIRSDLRDLRLGLPTDGPHQAGIFACLLVALAQLATYVRLVWMA